MNAHDKDVRTASLFRNGRSQAVRIPKEFEFEGDEVLITRDQTGKLILEPSKKKRSPKELVEWLRAQSPLGPEDRFPDIDDSDLPPLDDIEL
ncbi:MAG: AbrB/MazE/SpoVT family DNA-binding domain-containing protein [Rhizobiales bacterium]|nr:AbrB/MazE/SpoVT family DNA-binding domain-containing protein [Hyphomicrobiales bacterium]